MSDVIINNLDLWTSAILTKSTAGRGSNGKQQAYGIKKLRELILELAVRGKLVPQDPSDEPASVLLGKIAREKEKLIKKGKIKRHKTLSPINNEERPFELPNGWEWTRLGDFVYIEMGQSPSSKFYNQEENGLPFFQGKADFGDKHPTPRYWCVQPNKYAYPNDVLLSVRAPVGPTNIANIECCIGRGLAALRPLQGVPTNFIDCLLKGFRNILESFATGTTFAAVSKSDVENLVVTVPPLKQQHRIVAKVDELMALCDQLEQQQTNSLEAHQTLVETLLGTLTNVESAKELAEAWTRIAGSFDTLFTTEHSIDQLKQTILQLAVMGKLVPQVPNDEPASLLLEKIAEEKERMVREGAIRKEKPLSAEISGDEIPFNLPKGWAWVRLGEIVFIRGGKRVSNGYQLLSTPTPHIYIRVSDMKDGSIDDSDLKYIDEEMYSKISQYIITKNDVYMTIVGATIGKCGLVPDKFDGMNLTENAARLSPVIVSKYYLYKTLSTAFCQDQFIDKTKQVGVQKMALNRLASTLFPLPPLSEQHRIVAKVDELMALCDALKARLKDAQTIQIHLADAIVEQAVA